MTPKEPMEPNSRGAFTFVAIQGFEGVSCDLGCISAAVAHLGHWA